MTNRGSIQVRTEGVLGRIPAALLSLVVVAATAAAQTPVTAPQPTVPEIFTIEGEFVRVAYNNEGYASMGYRMAQQQVGEEWILLQVGLTLRKPTKDYKLKREHLSVTTPDGKTIPLATQQEYRGGMGAVSALNLRAKVNPDSINYFPNDVTRGCALRFFGDDAGRTLAFDETELGLPGPPLFQDPGRRPGRAALAERPVRRQLAAGALPDPHEGRGEGAGQAVAGAEEAARGRIQGLSSARRSGG
jgi:hypothetical protein